MAQGAANARLLRKILADAEDDRHAACAREPRELECDRVRPEQPDGLEPIELGAEDATRADKRTEQRTNRRNACVVRKRNEADPRR